MSLRNFVFTLNNPDDDDRGDCCHEWLEAHCSYFVYGHETGKNGTPHLQGYCELKKRIAFEVVRKVTAWHIESRKGTAAQASLYCKKDGDFVEHGEISNQGCRNDLDRARAAALTEGMREVVVEYNHQAIRVCEKMLTYVEEPRTWKTYVTYIYGPSGAGKSKLARELAPDAFMKNDCTKWWEGYDAHEDVIIDDFRDDWWPITELLSLLDRYAKRIEFKGGTRQFKPHRIIITSIKSPESLYLRGDEPNYQILRRLWCIINLSDVDLPEVGGVILTPL